MSITLQSSSKSFFYPSPPPSPAALLEAFAMSLTSPGELEEKSIGDHRAKLQIFCTPQPLCFALTGSVSSPLSLPPPRAGKKRPLVVCQWFVLLSPHKSWWTEMSLQCGVMSGGCLWADMQTGWWQKSHCSPKPGFGSVRYVEKRSTFILLRNFIFISSF